MTPYPQNLKPIDIIIQGSRLLGIPLSLQASAKMACHLELLLAWQKRINLTSLRNPHDIAVFHFLDSLTTLKVIPHQERLRILDIGTGAGFPGIVIKTVNEDTELILLDRHPGKIVFLKHVTKQIDLRSVTFLNCSLEKLLEAKDSHTYDLVISRAFSSEASFWNSLHVLVRSGGYLVRMAGPSSAGKVLSLKYFKPSLSWEGFLPFSSSFRQVSLYSRII